MTPVESQLEDFAAALEEYRTKGTGEQDSIRAAMEILRRYEGEKIRRIRTQYRRIEVKRLQDEGYSVSEIARRVGISISRVYGILSNS